MGFIRFMSSPGGRGLRVVAGLGIIAIGLWPLNGVSGGVAGIVVAVVGLAPFLAGVFDFCIFAPFARLPLAGHAIRARL